MTLKIFSMDFFMGARRIIEVGGLLLILAIIYVETGFFLGFVLPGGDYMLFAAGMLCGSHYLDLPLPALVSLMIIAAFMGDLTGYYKGKWLGGKFFTGGNSRFFKQEYLERGSRFYHRFGLWAFILGRFLPVIRTLVPMISGATSVPMKRFLLFNALGAVTWVGTLAPLGYFIGKRYPDVINYTPYILDVFILIVFYPVFKLLFAKIK